MNCSQKLILFFFILIQAIIISLTSFAQLRCNTFNLKNKVNTVERITNAGKRQAAQTADLETMVIMPVVVHVIHTSVSGVVGGSGNSNISNAQIESQIRVLNEDYQKKPGTNGYNSDPKGADLRIEFKLANKDPNGTLSTGINRIYNSKTVWNPASEDAELKALSYWPCNQYLNIWVVPAIYDNVLGYAQFPSASGYKDLDDVISDSITDGVVIAHTAFGTTGTVKGKYVYGRTTTHEVGHWLGLVHIWGDKDCGDDYIEDTPVQLGPNTYISENCPPHYSKCNNVSTLDMSNNYMDLSPDICMNIFTVGQKQRIRNVIYSSPRRKAILYSTGYDSVLTVTESMHPSAYINWNIYEGILRIKSDEVVASGIIEIYDLFGRVIYKQQLLSDGQSLEVPLKDLQSGLLICSFSSNSTTTNFEFLNELM